MMAKTKEEILDELKNAEKILVTISDFGYSRKYGIRFPYYNIWILKKDGRIYQLADENCPYWNKKKKAYGVVVFGMDAVFKLLCYWADFDCKLANELDRKALRLWT